MRCRFLFGALAAALVLAGGGVAHADAASGNQWPATFVAGTSGKYSTLIWEAQQDGAVITGTGLFYGDARNYPLAQPIVGIATTPSEKGYWLAAADGGVFSYGDARFSGSMVGKHLNAPIVGIASSGHGGYWLVAADGGVFSFGGASFLGSLGGRQLDQPIVGISALKSGAGYRLVARDGGVFTFGKAVFHGSLGGTGLTDVVGMATTPTGNGYWILRKLGGTYQCGNPTSAGGCAAVASPVLGPTIPGPSVYNFGDARNMQPSFTKFQRTGPPMFDGPDFVADPAVGIVSDPEVQSYIVLRAHAGADGFAG